jgi:hypothetical protein
MPAAVGGKEPLDTRGFVLVRVAAIAQPVSRGYNDSGWEAG